jgi:hypothetical protein
VSAIAKTSKEPGTCTWEDCTEHATKPRIAQDGSKWADLCDQHDRQIQTAIDTGSVSLLSFWVKAQGGAKAAARRM